MAAHSKDRSLLTRLLDIGVTADCDEASRASRRVFTGAALAIGLLSPFWGILYFLFGEVGPGLIPSVYSVFTLISFVILGRSQRWELFRKTQLILIFVLPFVLMWSLGGYILGSAVMIWALFAPVGSLWSGSAEEARRWAVAFLVAAVGSGLVEGLLPATNDLPDSLVVALFVLNISAVTGVILYLLAFDRAQKDEYIDVLSRNRELEAAYLAQEITLRQSDKLATLGKLSAGMAHELNNPSAAVQQAVAELSQTLNSSGLARVECAALGLNGEENRVFAELNRRIEKRVEQPLFLDPLERSDNETSLQEWLEIHGVDDPWEVAPLLVDVGLSEADLERVSETFRPPTLAGALGTLADRYRRASLLAGLAESTGRIVGLVSALKSYTYLDQGAKQAIDVHEGLDMTLVMLKHQLKAGVKVARSYAAHLPRVEAYGSEINQVWTNLLDNAIHAMDGVGSIEISTRHEAGWVVVEIADSGAGIAPEIIEQIFDPFVTTKGPGEGTGLGLNISHGIVTQKHGGSISVESRPGRTVFRVMLPIANVVEETIPKQIPAESEGP